MKIAYFSKVALLVRSSRSIQLHSYSSELRLDSFLPPFFLEQVLIVAWAIFKLGILLFQSPSC